MSQIDETLCGQVPTPTLPEQLAALTEAVGHLMGVVRRLDREVRELSRRLDEDGGGTLAMTFPPGPRPDFSPPVIPQAAVEPPRVVQPQFRQVPTRS